MRYVHKLVGVFRQAVCPHQLRRNPVCVLPCDALLNASYIDDCPFIIYCRVFRFQPQCYHTVICGQLLESCAAVR